MGSESTLKRVKTEREFLWESARTGALIILAATLFSLLVAWMVVANHDPQIRAEAMLTSLILPPLVAVPSLAYTTYQSLKNHRLMLQVARLANTDEMTGLPNRRAFMRQAAEHLNQTDLASRGMCMFLIDLDHFKAVNDQFGHNAGDQTLIHVASRMRRSVPNNALTARLGGEEFAVFLPFDEFADIHSQAETLREAVAGSFCLVDGHKISVTVSVGIGIVGPGDTVSTVLSRADCALYEAKNAGRNRFSIAA